MIIAIVARKKHFYDFFCVEPGDEINMYNYYTYLEKKYVAVTVFWGSAKLNPG